MHDAEPQDVLVATAPSKITPPAASVLVRARAWSSYVANEHATGGLPTPVA